MTYYSDMKSAIKPFPDLTSDKHCFECGKEIAGASVGYNGYAEPERFASIYMHAACAAVMGQRLIVDGYPNRHNN